jgi:hypothetical protein
MSDMEFDKFVKPLENSLDSWRQGQQKKKETAAKRKKDADSKPGSETTRCLSYLKLQIFVTRTVYIFVTFNLYSLEGQVFCNPFEPIFLKYILVK